MDSIMVIHNVGHQNITADNLNLHLLIVSQEEWKGKLLLIQSMSHNDCYASVPGDETGLGTHASH